MTKEHEMRTEYRAEGGLIDGELFADCGVRVGPFKNKEQLTTYVLCFQKYMEEASDRAMKDAFGDAEIRKGEQHVERSGSIQ